MYIKNKIHRVKQGARPYLSFEDPQSLCGQNLLDTGEFFQRSSYGAVFRVVGHAPDDTLVRECMSRELKHSESYGLCPECEEIWEQIQRQKGIQLLRDLD